MTDKYLRKNLSDFVTIRKSGYTYIDKTMYIPQIEHGADYAFYVRPHGMGNSTLISMLMAYYDINMKDEWQTLFNNLYIGNYPTPGKNKYLVAEIDFSLLSGNINSIQTELYSLYYAEFERILNYYKKLLTPELTYRLRNEIKKMTSPTDVLALICSEVKKLGYEFYLFIDGFDAIANGILRQGGRINYTDDLQVSNMRTYFKFFDSINMASHLSIAKIFAVGTVPIAISKFFAGFDRGTFYTTEPDFAMLSGFTPTDLKNIIDNHPLREQFKHSPYTLISDMMNNFGGYCFAPKYANAEKLINCSEAFNYLEQYINTNFTIPQSTSLCDKCPIIYLRDKQYDIRTSALRDTFRGSRSLIVLEKIILIDKMYDPRYFYSLMYYCGALTIVGEKWGELLLNITNQNLQKNIEKYFGSFSISDDK